SRSSSRNFSCAAGRKRFRRSRSSWATIGCVNLLHRLCWRSAVTRCPTRSAPLCRRQKENGRRRSSRQWTFSARNEADGKDGAYLLENIRMAKEWKVMRVKLALLAMVAGSLVLDRSASSLRAEGCLGAISAGGVVYAIDIKTGQARQLFKSTRLSAPAVH